MIEPMCRCKFPYTIEDSFAKANIPVVGDFSCKKRFSCRDKEMALAAFAEGNVRGSKKGPSNLRRGSRF